MRHPDVSVVIAVYNGTEFLQQAIDSVLQQSFTNFELIVVDDGSTDQTGEILRGNTDSRLRVIRNERNTGIAFSRNRGLAMARAPYLACMDADDLSSVERFSRQVAFLNDHPEIALVGSYVKIIDGNGRVGATLEVPTDPGTIASMILRVNCLAHTSVMARKSCILDVGGYDETMACALDYDLWLRMAERYKLANLPECLVNYRIHPGQISLTRLKKQRELANESRRRALNRRARNGSSLVSANKPLDRLDQLTAADGTIGADYISWSNRFGAVGDRQTALALALHAIKASPLSNRAYFRVLNVASEFALGPDRTRALRWWARRISMRA